MNSSVGVLNCDYRAAGPSAPPGPLELGHHLQGDLVPALTDGLALVFGQDPTVYIVRRVDCELTMRCDKGALPEVARRLGSAATNAVMRAIADGVGANVIRFRDETEYITQCVIDLLEDRAASRWYYASFADALEKSRPEALAEVLLGAPHAAMLVLGRLHSRAYLEQALRYLPNTVLARIVDSEPTVPEEVLRPLFSAALALCSELLMPPTLPFEQLLSDYAATRPPSPDWRDRRSLTKGTLDALRFLLRGQALRLAGEAALASIAEAAGRLDWLDEEILRDGIARSTLEPTRPPEPDGQPVPRFRAPRAARQLALLRDLSAACAMGWPTPECEHGETPANRVRMMAALVAHSERWAIDPVASELVAALLRELAANGHDDRPLLRELAAIGTAPAQDSLTPRGAPGRSSKSGTRTEHAGLLLLVRAGLELRLNALADAARFLERGEALATLLLGLVDAGSPDPGLAAVLGAPDSRSREDSEESREAFERAQLNALAARGLLGGQPCFHRLDDRGPTLLLAGLEHPEIWPLTQAVADGGDVELTLARWHAEWSAATGAPCDAFCPGGGANPLAGLLSPPTCDIPADRTKLTIAAAALVLVRVWGRWLPGLGQSSLRFLLEHFIRRPGTVRRHGEAVVVTLDRGPLDAVLSLSGALAEIDARHALGVTIRFEPSPP